jgi:hypothetical protein
MIYLKKFLIWFGLGFMVFNTTFNHHRKSLTNFTTLCCIEYTLPWTGFELTILLVIVTDCTCSCKSIYHTIMTTTPPPPHLMLNNNHNNHFLVDDRVNVLTIFLHEFLNNSWFMSYLCCLVRCSEYKCS